MENDYDDYKLLDREEAIKKFCEIINQKDSKKSLHVIGDTFMGKSRVLREYKNISENEYKYHTAMADLRDEDPISILENIATQIGTEKFKNFNKVYQEYLDNRVTLKKINIKNSQLNISANTSYPRDSDIRIEKLTHAFIRDIASIQRKKRVVLLFDTVDEINDLLCKWLGNTFYKKTELFMNTRIVFAGKSIPFNKEIYINRAYKCKLAQIDEIDPFLKFCESINLNLTENDVKIIWAMFKGNPGLFVQYIPNLLDHK